MSEVSISFQLVDHNFRPFMGVDNVSFAKILTVADLRNVVKNKNAESYLRHFPQASLVVYKDDKKDKDYQDKFLSRISNHRQKYS